MFAKGMRIGWLMLFAFSLAAAAPVADRQGDPEPGNDGIVTVRSAYALGETIDRLKQDIASKGITFFTAIDQSELAARAGIRLRSVHASDLWKSGAGCTVHNVQSSRRP